MSDPVNLNISNLRY